MEDRWSDRLQGYRTQIKQRWREANQLCLELYLDAMEDTDVGTVAAIRGRFDSVLADLQAPVEDVATYDDLIPVLA